MSEIKESDSLEYFMKGNQDAVRLCVDLIYVAHLWDDLIDKDKLRTDDDINLAFRKTLLDIPSNPFYKEHANDLQPIMRNVVFAWYDANALEKGDKGERIMGFVARNELLNVLGYCIFLTGGYEWQSVEGLNFRKYCAQTMAVKLEEFLNEKEVD